MHWMLLLIITAIVPLTYSLQWYDITDPLERGALCNDFTTAGYFIRRNVSNFKWIIFLEGGGGCTNPRKCNERFIDYRVRKRFTTLLPNGTLQVDVKRAWDSRANKLKVISPLMTTIKRFAPNNNNSQWRIEGRDLLSTNPRENPTFYTYNHVLVPYCSSDLFLLATNDYKRALDRRFKFVFNPFATKHQFTFRGAAIFQSIVQDLITFHSLLKASDVILAGSSAGGIGAMNHAQWTQEQLSSFTKLSLITDSAWFINFKNTINEQLLNENGDFFQSDENSTCDSQDNPSLCLSAPIILTDPSSYPNIPTFVLFSQYDLYLLTLSILNATSSTSQGGIIELMRIVSEYSGFMISTREHTSLHFDNLSYYVTSCFHHVYFATSELWGDQDAILGNEAIDENYGNNRFVHKIQSGIWRTFSLTPSSPGNHSKTIAEAIDEWLHVRYTGSVIGYMDGCTGPRCNPLCPEEITLGQVSTLWRIELRIGISLFVASISIVSFIVKISFYIWYKVILKRQLAIIESHAVDPYKGLVEESNLPVCDEADAISVSCLNLRYSVTLKDSTLKKSPNTSTDAYVAQRYKRLLSMSAIEQNPQSKTKGANQKSEEQENNVMVNALYEFQRKHQQNQQQSKTRKFVKKQTTENKGNNKMTKKKEILKGISAYFNPGEMVAIMGPSGCGKTTFIDLLAGRQNLGSYQGDIYVNGQRVDDIREWYVAHTGYVLQLATPYYDSLTVRENLTLSAQMRLPHSYSLNKKLNRVEQILRETGLTSLANTVVGSCVGPGLSGGQKRRLCVALQLLNMPSLIFLDEPTSGLDSSSSLELLTHLNNIASSNRTVILTIHQPRLEIYHMFSQIILLCQGQVAYHGIPENAYQFFLTAHLNATLNVKKLEDMASKNPADMIVDMLGSEESRQAILDHYRNTQESQKIARAIEKCRRLSLQVYNKYSNKIERKRKSKENRPSWFDQLAALEARARKMTTLTHSFYLPAIFLLYGFLLGTVFLATQSSTFILTGFGVFSCASGLFMFPAVYNYLFQALQMFVLEYSDGIGSTWQLIFQTFTRFVGISTLPVITGATIVYLLIIPYSQYRLVIFAQSLVFNAVLNFCWIALLMFVITAVPRYAHRISPVLSAIAGFAGGFFIPPSLMPPWYSWLFYVNPNYYGFSAIARTVLGNIDLNCNYQSSLECYPSTGAYILSYFNLDQVNPTLHVIILLLMTGVFLLLSWISLLIRHSLPKICSFFKKISQYVKTHGHQRGSSDAFAETLQRSIEGSIIFSPQNDDLCSDVFEWSPTTTTTEEREKEKEIENTPLKQEIVPAVPSSSSLLQEGQTHEVWIPGKRSTIRRSFCSKGDIEMRRKSLLQRVSSVSLPDQATLRKQNKPSNDMLKLRMTQWNKIEEDSDSDECDGDATTPQTNQINASEANDQSTTSNSLSSPIHHRSFEMSNNNDNNNNKVNKPAKIRLHDEIISESDEEEESKVEIFLENYQELPEPFNSVLRDSPVEISINNECSDKLEEVNECTIVKNQCTTVNEYTVNESTNANGKKVTNGDDQLTLPRTRKVKFVTSLDNEMNLRVGRSTCLEPSTIIQHYDDYEYQDEEYETEI